MVIRWGRKGLVAAAFAVSFVTPDATVTTSVHKADLRPSYKQVVRHITPSGDAPTLTSIHKVDLQPSYKQVVRHVTPSGEVVIPPVVTLGGTSGANLLMKQILREDEELLTIVAAAVRIVT